MATLFAFLTLGVMPGCGCDFKAECPRQDYKEASARVCGAEFFLREKMSESQRATHWVAFNADDTLVCACAFDGTEQLSGCFVEE